MWKDGVLDKLRRPRPKSVREKISRTLTGTKFSKKRLRNITKALRNRRTWTLSEKTKNKMRIAAINRLQNVYGKKWVSYNKRSCIFFRKLNDIFQINGLHAENEGEYIVPVLGYSVDFYDKKNNIVIEWNEERHHYLQGKLCKKHMDRQNKIKKQMKCIFINIRQKTFKEKEFIEKFSNILTKLHSDRKLS